jgi:hypothetical protein
MVGPTYYEIARKAHLIWDDIWHWDSCFLMVGPIHLFQLHWVMCDISKRCHIVNSVSSSQPHLSRASFPKARPISRLETAFPVIHAASSHLCRSWNLLSEFYMKRRRFGSRGFCWEQVESGWDCDHSSLATLSRAVQAWKTRVQVKFAPLNLIQLVLQDKSKWSAECLHNMTRHI